jgi:hypothetical protein
MSHQLSVQIEARPELLLLLLLLLLFLLLQEDVLTPTTCSSCSSSSSDNCSGSTLRNAAVCNCHVHLGHTIRGRCLLVCSQNKQQERHTCQGAQFALNIPTFLLLTTPLLHKADSNLGIANSQGYWHGIGLANT